MGKKREGDLEEKVASISSLADDQGGGASFCGNCDNNITKYLNSVKPAEELRCPKCKHKLAYSGAGIEPYPFGGSDY